MTSLFEKFNEAQKASNDEHYSTISVRTPSEIASMVETVSTVTQEAVINMFTSSLSSYLASYLLEDSRNMDLIKQVLDEQYDKHDHEVEKMVSGSCIEVLEDENILKVSNYIDFDSISFKLKVARNS
ncbi:MULTISPECIES: hypothetical protein [unclassified Psychrobacter]|uniref:hypothetical protein n=1 Tax=unclassified Psychrobacter TaxID=196806 RepID=UPI00402BA28E